MKQYTKEMLTDEDITIERVANRLRKISKEIKKSNKLNLCDINIICEEIFGEILNILYGYELTVKSMEAKSNYVAVDLVDENNKIAFQVTSRVDVAKIKDTLRKFVKNELYKNIDSLYILILSDDLHNYRDYDKEVDIKTRENFSIRDNVINFEKLISIIEDKSRNNHKLLVDIYDHICMIFESGRLSWKSILSKTEELSEERINHTKENYGWKKGYGDVCLFAFVPKTYEEQLSCLLEFRQSDIEGMYITIDQEELVKDYFVTREIFKDKHIVGREISEDDSWIDIGNVRMRINAHSADHLYRLFDELWNSYKEATYEINKIMGVKGMLEKEGKYLIANISKEEWEKVIRFAENHRWDREGGEEKWNIFNILSNNCLFLSPYLYGNKGKGIIHAEIRSEILNNDTVNVYWKPGYKDTSYYCMDYFDNKVKWKANYTKDWFMDCLLPKIIEEDQMKFKDRSIFEKIYLKLRHDVCKELLKL